jgi:hypothetical protein
MEWPGRQPSPPRRQAGDWSPEPWHGQPVTLLTELCRLIHCFRTGRPRQSNIGRILQFVWKWLCQVSESELQTEDYIFSNSHIIIFLVQLNLCNCYNFHEIILIVKFSKFSFPFNLVLDWCVKETKDGWIVGYLTLMYILPVIYRKMISKMIGFGATKGCGRKRPYLVPALPFSTLYVEVV